MSITGEEIRASHVPGPWSVGHIRPQGVHKSLQPMYEAPIHVGEGATRGNCHTIVYGGGPGAGSSTEEDVRANARLIAAAPDLLALAKQYAEECATCGGCGECDLPVDGSDDELESVPCIDCADIRAVIAKAEGSQS